MAESNKKKFVVFALITGIIGFIAGILTAPKSGKETRQDIADKAGDIKSASLEKLKEVESELARVIAETRSKAAKLTAPARAEFDEAAAKARIAQDKTKSIIKAVKNGKADNSDLDAAIKQGQEAVKNLKKYLKN